MICEKHGEYEAKSISMLGKTFSIGCPKCEQEREEADRKEQEIAQEAIRIVRLRSFNIEPMYLGATLDNLEILTDDHRRAVDYARSMISEKRGKLVLLGSNGTGKTHIAVGVVRELRGAIYSMYEITTRIRASYVSGAKETELEIVDNLSRLPMLAIDEIGRTKGSDAETNWLSYIIDKRHVRKLPLILISNKHTKKTCPSNGCDKCLENYISEDVMSRLAEDGHLVTFSGDDYRRKKRADNNREA